jgi:hypothetical protein
MAWLGLPIFVEIGFDRNFLMFSGLFHSCILRNIYQHFTSLDKNELNQSTVVFKTQKLLLWRSKVHAAAHNNVFGELFFASARKVEFLSQLQMGFGIKELIAPYN